MVQLPEHPESVVVGGEYADWGQPGFDARQGHVLSAGKTGFVGFVFGRSQVQVWLRRSLGVTEAFHGFLPSVQASSGTIFCIRLTASFQILSNKYLLIVRHSALYILNYVHGLFFFISNLIHCFYVYVQYLLSSFLYMFQASQAHHQEV